MRFWDKIANSINSFLGRRQFIKGVALLTGGVVLGRAIVVLASPILTRIYTPKDFGVLAVYSSLLSIVSVIACLRYEVAIPIPEEDEDAAAILQLALIVLVLFAFLGSLFIVRKCGDWIVRCLNISSLFPYLWMVPLGVLIVGVFQILNYWAIRKQDFGPIAQARVGQNFAMVLSQVSYGYVKGGPVGLLLGRVIGPTIGSLLLALRAIKGNKIFISPIGIRKIGKVGWRYRKFPIFSSWAGIFNTLSVQIPTLLLSGFFGSSVTGLYALSYQVAGMPMQLIGQSVGQVFFSKAAEAKHQGNVSYITEVVFKHLVVFAFPFFLLLALSAPDLFSFVFGSKWIRAGVYTRWLTPWLFLVFITSPLSTLFLVMEKQWQDMAFQIVLLLSRSVALVIGNLFKSPDLAIGLFSSVSAGCWFVLMLWVLRISGNKIYSNLKYLLDEGMKAIPLVAPFIVAKITVKNDSWLVAGFLLSACLIACKFAYFLWGEKI